MIFDSNINSNSKQHDSNDHRSKIIYFSSDRSIDTINFGTSLLASDLGKLGGEASNESFQL